MGSGRDLNSWEMYQKSKEDNEALIHEILKSHIEEVYNLSPDTEEAKFWVWVIGKKQQIKAIRKLVDLMDTTVFKDGLQDS